MKNFSKLFLAFLLTNSVCSLAFAEPSFNCPKPSPKENIFSSPIDKGSIISIEDTKDKNYPKSLVVYNPDIENKCARYVFAKYSMEGGSPQIESIFFYKLDGVVNIFSIVSWDQDHRALGTYGKLYQVYAYKKDNNGTLVENKHVVDDNSMTGIDGYENGESSKFLYKKASDVKAYFARKKDSK